MYSCYILEYKCTFCPMTFNAEKYQLAHIKICPNNKSTPWFICELCEKAKEREKNPLKKKKIKIFQTKDTKYMKRYVFVHTTV